MHLVVLFWLACIIILFSCIRSWKSSEKEPKHWKKLLGKLSTLPLFIRYALCPKKLIHVLDKHGTIVFETMYNTILSNSLLGEPLNLGFKQLYNRPGRSYDSIFLWWFFCDSWPSTCTWFSNMEQNLQHEVKKHNLFIRTPPHFLILMTLSHRDNI